MHQNWKTIDLFVPSVLTHREAVEYLYTHIRAIAHDGGDFIHDVRLGAGRRHSQEWDRWTASYLPGPPGSFERGSR
ncbi:MAG: hypothetical protein JWR34_6477 [Mycobacterium sp.]|jgi:hypothetical protein|nr:hypothetical protein [Mycobacterium sp.]